jgi:predicted dehydrogenase
MSFEAVSKAGVSLQVGFMRRYDPAYSAAMKRIEAGKSEPRLFSNRLDATKRAPRFLRITRMSTGCCFTQIRSMTSTWRGG